MDIFKQDAFSLVSMLEAFEEVDYQPTTVRQLGIYPTERVYTPSVDIENRAGVLSLIPTSPRGAPIPDHRLTEKRKIRSFNVPRIAKDDTIHASEILGMRAFGRESEMMQVMAEVDRRINGPVGILRDVELTWENMALGAAQGLLLDADGSTLYDYFSEFGITQATELDFDLDNATPATGALYLMCQKVIKQMMVASKGAWTTQTRVIGLCGEAFWNDLIVHPEIQKLWELQIQGGFQDGLQEFLGYAQRVTYGGITFVCYRGTDDGSTVAIGTDKCKFIPMNAPGVFSKVFAPGESFSHIGGAGRDFYPLIVPDRDRDMWVKVEIYSYPLFICKRPAMLQRAKRT